MRCLFALSFAVLLIACPAPVTPDAGPIVIEGPPCETSKDCKRAAFEGVCRTGTCVARAPCTDDVECGLGENCVAAACKFTGCVVNSDCASGTCRADVFTCAECGAHSDCPSSRPVCDPSNKCVLCTTDAQCSPPGPAHCEVTSGACVHCLENKHCPNGLTCGALGVCSGAKLNAACPTGTACDSGLICVALGGINTCLNGCSLSSPSCKAGEICYRLTYLGGSGLVFDQGGPLGVCYLPQPNLKGYREACTRPSSSASTSNCQPNLTCIPDSATTSSCRTFCDLNLSGACPSSEKCQPFKGDFNGRLYGLCYPDNGWGSACTRDSACNASQSCEPYDDPSASANLTAVCQFSVGASPGLSPCKNSVLPDAGTLTADKSCRSGSCQADPLLSSVKFFCYSACKTDEDCTVAGRTGSCDGDFVFPGAVANATVKGCRPACTSSVGCAEYGANIACRSRFVPGYTPSFVTSCAPPAGPRVAGAECSLNSQCKSGFCLLEDGRGSARVGYCAEGCDTAADCAADAGSPTGPLQCAPLTFLGFKGFDGVPGTPDDKLLTAKLCGGSGCEVDQDCRPDGGARCVPDADPLDAGQSLVLRCRPSHASGILGGASPCNQDSDCASGVCGTLQAPSTGTGKACFQACIGATVCPGSSTCRLGGLRVSTHFAILGFDSCAP